MLSNITPEKRPPCLHFCVPCEPAHLLRARERLRDYLGNYCADGALIDDLVLCVEEAATNAIRHSGVSDDIEISVQFVAERLVAAVKDHGHGFDVASFDPQRSPDPSADHGRGLFIMAVLMDELELRLNDGLEVRMARQAEPRCEPARLESGLGESRPTGSVGQREARTRAVLEEIDEAFVALNWEYRYVHANEAALRLTKKSRAELLGHTPWELFPPLLGSALERAYRKAMELGLPAAFEHRALGSGDWFEVRIYPTSAGISAYFREINERKRIEREVLASRSELAATLATVTDGFYTLDRRWCVSYLNDQAAVVFPVAKEKVLGANFWELFPEALGSDFETNKRRAMAHGEFRSFEAYYPPLATWFAERDYPSKDGITVLFTDISARKRAEADLQAQSEQLREQGEEITTRVALAEALNAISSVVHATLDAEVIMQRALGQGVAALSADAGTIEQREEESWVVACQQGFSGEEVGLRLNAEQAPIASRAWARAQPFAIADLELEPALNVGFPHAHGLRTVLAVPLIVRKDVRGCLLFYGRRPRSFAAAEVDFARKLGVTVALALDNARLYLDQRRIAQTLQENFIHPLPAVRGLELGVVAATAAAPELVGGDFSDVFLLDDSHVVVLIGDVAGKGVRAAGLTETVRSTVRAFATIDASPAFVLRMTNQLLLRRDVGEELVTAFLISLDTLSGRATFASAGHPPPVHLRAAASELLKLPFGLPLGSFDEDYREAQLRLTPADVLVLYTDGVTEARRGRELFGYERLVETVSALRAGSVQELAQGVSDAALAFAGTLKDDLHVVVLRLVSELQGGVCRQNASRTGWADLHRDSLLASRGATIASVRLPGAVKESASVAQVARIKVTLKGIRPPIWRRVEVPLDLSLARFSDVILAAFAWSNSHLHEFTVGQRRIGRPDPGERRPALRLLNSAFAAAADDLVGLFAHAPLEDETHLDLAAVLAAGVRTFSYTYDFGDDWQHLLRVEAILPAAVGLSYPRCMAGRRSCPPEDCGGVWAYEHLLQVFADPNHEEYAELREQYPHFEPAAFDCTAADQAVRNPPEYWE